MNSRVEQLFHQLADLSHEARANYFAQNPVDEAVRREVEALLDFDSGASTFLERGVGASATRALPQLEPTGLRCGPYRLLEVIGRGGMGTVYLADRVDGELSQRLAVKLLPFGAGDPQRERFLQERQILAPLAHPNIARLLDAGHAENGQPFLAMEYVDGKPIDLFASGLVLNDKVRLFLKVCDAVGYLHRNLVVHRDLKPGNILVTPDGEPKLLDFGISKLLDVPGDRTVTCLRALTPDYASPEQVTGGRVTTATDIYSLGAVLHQLLTGKPPHVFDEPSPEGILQGLAEREVPRPSQSAPELKGDLDCILLKALRKDPQERYRTTQDFAADLEAYLESRPVKARSGNSWYLTRKMLRRHWATAALVAVAFRAVAAGTVATSVEARVARRQRDFAYQQLSRFEAVNDFYSFVVSESPDAQNVLDRAERLIQRGYSENLGIRAELLYRLALNTGSEHGRDKVRKRVEDAYHAAVAANDISAWAESACYLGLEIAIQGDLNRGEALVKEGLAKLPSRPEYLVDRSFCLNRGAYVARYRNDPREAIARSEAAVRALEQSPFRSDLQAAMLSMELGNAYRSDGRNREAITLFKQVIAKLAAVGSDETAYAGSNYYRWSLAEASLGHPLEALRLSSKAMAIFDGEESEDLPPFLVVNHASILRDLGRLGEAAERAERADARARRLKASLDFRDALLVRSSIDRMRGDLPKAAGTLAELEPLMVGALPAGHINFALLRSEQSLQAEARGDSAAALDLVNQAMRIAEASIQQGGRGADMMAKFLTERSRIERDLNRFSEADADAAKALKLAQDAAVPGTYSTVVGNAWLALGRALQAEGQPERAGAAFRSAVEHLANALGADHPDARAARELASLTPSNR